MASSAPVPAVAVETRWRLWGFTAGTRDPAGSPPRRPGVARPPPGADPEWTLSQAGMPPCPRSPVGPPGGVMDTSVPPGTGETDAETGRSDAVCYSAGIGDCPAPVTVRESLSTLHRMSWTHLGGSNLAPSHPSARSYSPGLSRKLARLPPIAVSGVGTHPSLPERKGTCRRNCRGHGLGKTDSPICSPWAVSP